MAEMVISQGLNDTQAYLQAIANVKAPFNVTPSSGNYPLMNNTLVNRRLASMWIATNLASRVFVDGMGVASYSAESENVGFLRIPLLYMPPRLKRTLGTKLFPSDENNGTQGNNLPFNRNLPHAMQTDGYDLKFIQTYDEAAQISRKETLMIGTDLDILGQYTSNVPKTVGFLQDADIMATIIGAGLANAAKKGNSNIIAYDPAADSDGYLQSILNQLVSKLSNVRGSYAEGVVSYDRSKSVIVMRWSLFNKLMTIKNGALVNSDIAQKILLNGYLDESGEKLLGSSVYGKYMGVYIKVVADELFDTAAATLNLSLQQYGQFSKVSAFIASGEGTLFGQSYTVTDVDKAPTTSLGYIVRNDWGWGIKNVRPSSVALLVESANGLADFVNPVPEFEDINSPNNMEQLIAQYQQSAADLTYAVQRIGVTPTDLVTTVTVTVLGTSSSPINNANVIVADQFGNYPTVTNNGNGAYTFELGRATTANVAIVAEGYEATSEAITATNTAGASHSVSITLTAAKAKNKAK